MITFLIVLLFLTIFIQPSAVRLHTALAFVVGVLIHEIFYSEYEGLFYHASSALASLGSIIALGYIPCKQSRYLIAVLIAMITADVAGYFLWLAYVEPIYYNFIIGILFSAAIYILCSGGSNVRNIRDIKLNSYIFRDISTRFSYLLEGSTCKKR